MEVIKNLKARLLISVLIALWLATWGYFMLLNWDIFTVKINIDLGFTLIKGRPFVLFFLLGLIIIILIQYSLQYLKMLQNMEIKDKNTKITMQDKDIEILKLKEMLYKEQSSEFNKSAQDISDLHEKVEKIAQSFEEQKNSDTPSES